jgi:hypothetical protein
VLFIEDQFTLKCFPFGDTNWEFECPVDRLLPLIGTITDESIHTPDMWDSDGEPCLLVVKSGNATNTTLGRANGLFSIVCDYFTDMLSESGFLLIDSHIYVPDFCPESGILQTRPLQLKHDHTTAGHPGQNRTLDLL